jgi:hypothetical protein
MADAQICQMGSYESHLVDGSAKYVALVEIILL